ncbi:MAG: low molecular weight phosphotyrosine protein phosphatase [Planctomycetes bacterium]|nr:low molecular weight phosphotyrosine protein phosphatase [Planctomycetota bacterium]
MATHRVLFVCLGNICRSPLAEGLFLHHARREGVDHRFEIDSAGTGGWHSGERADPRMRATAARHGVELTSRARQVVPRDFTHFDSIVAMDDSNVEHLVAAGAPRARVRLLLEADPAAEVREVPDPYYGGVDGFEQVYRLVDSACQKLLAELVARSNDAR